MKHTGSLVLIVASFFYAGGICFAETVMETVDMSVAPVPGMAQVIGEDEKVAVPTRYPEFVNVQSPNNSCGEKLKKKGNAGGISLRKKNGRPDFDENNNPVEPEPGEWSTVLTIPSYVVPEKYRNSAKLLVTWTIRIIGEIDAPVDIGGVLDSTCSDFTGTTWQRFRGGTIKSHLYIDDVPNGQDVSMTMPDAGTISSTEPPPAPRDPTISGSFTLTGPFTGKAMKFDIKWYNDTSMRIRTLPRMRNLIITVLPLASKN